MKETKQAIEDAIKGGYSPISFDNGTSAQRQEVARDYIFDPIEPFPPEIILLDPKFWEALGRTRGWDYAHCYMCKTDVRLWGECECDEDEVTPVAHMAWQYKCHQFIDHRFDGKSIEESLLAISE